LGPNSVPSTASNYTLVTGVNSQAISFMGSSSSYFQASGFASFGITSQAFSIVLWVQPQALSGTLVQVSTNSSGTGSCASFLGFSSNGSLVAQMKTNTSYATVLYPSLLPLTSFTLIVQTWSSTNGLRLYINSYLVGSTTATSYSATLNWVNYVTVGGCLSGCSNCTAPSGNSIVPGPFAGAVDSFRIYSRELTSSEVCTLFVYK
jgi:hypothetical protein